VESFTYRYLYPYGEDRVYTIYPIGDTHIGHIGCDEGLLKEVVEEVAGDPYSFALGMGDYIDAIAVKDRRRFSPKNLASWVETSMLVDLPRFQVERFASLMEPLKGKWLGMLYGNHEWDLDHYGERSCYTDIVRLCKDKPDRKLAMGDSGFIRMVFRQGTGKGRGGVTYVLFAHHGTGAGGGYKLGGKALALDDIRGQFDADVYLLGDKHLAMTFPIGLRYYAGRYGIVGKTVWGAWTGSYLQGWLEGVDTYVSHKRYPPRPIGGVRIRIRPAKRDLKLEYFP